MKFLQARAQGETLLRMVTANNKDAEPMSMLQDPDIWVIDTGATCNSTGNEQGMTNKTNAKNNQTTVGNGAKVTAKFEGKIPFETDDGTKGTMAGVKLMPGSPFNLISGTKLLTMGYKMTGDANEILYEKEGNKLKFNIKVNTPEGMVLAARLKRTATEVGGAATEYKQTKTISIKKAHEQLGHMGEDETRRAAKALGWTITRGSLNKCESCAIGKAKQKNVKVNEPKEKSHEVNGRVFLDMSRIVGPNAEVQPKRPNWCIVVDQMTGKKDSAFYETKSDMVEPTCRKMKAWEEQGKPVKIIRMDNGGENKKLVKRLNSPEWKMYPTIEYTARDTPQHNHMAEVGLSTLYGRGRAMMSYANIPNDWKPIVAPKAFETASDLDGLVPVEVNGKVQPRDIHYNKRLPMFAYHLRTWGEAGVVKVKTSTSPKLSDRGVTCMFVGYAKDHAGDCYQMLNMETRRILETRDVAWLNRMYFDVPNDKDEEENNMPDVDDLVTKMNVHPPVDAAEPEGEGGNEDVATTRSGRTIRAPARLIEEIGANNVTSNKAGGEHFRNDEIMAVGAGIGGGFVHTSELIPMKYNEAIAKDPDGWNKAVDKEHERMLAHRVWKAIPRSLVPRTAKVLSSTWAMKQKADGTKRARINARGFEQHEGEHYDKEGISSPVVNEASIFIILILIIMARMWCELNDVKGAFLNGLFSGGETLYMEVPQGFKKFYPGDVLLLLLKTIYGLKQAAFEYWRALLKALKTVGLERSKADPCVYYKWTDEGLMIWSSWVDDLLSCGHKEDVVKGREAIKQHFELDEVGELKEYVGCKVEYNREEGWMELTQPVLIQSFEDEFEMPTKEYNTPAVPNSVLTGNDEGLLNESAHRNYRKGVGKLIHLGKYTKAECLNAIRELSRFGSKPNEAHYKAMIRAMRYCVSTKHLGLRLKPNKQWNPKDRNFLFEVTGTSDSDFAKDPETRRSVSGWAAFLNGAPYVRKSKMQQFVTMSVTEAECVAATSCVQDMLYGKRFLESLGLKVKLPMTLFMDNKGGVDIFNNWSIAGNTRAISVRLAFIRELKEAGIVEIKWLQGIDNCADLFTKNVDGVTFSKHASVFNGSNNTT
eukprot:scaffold1252_cov154-Amphora_coffeaeformis.AAC.1